MITRTVGILLAAITALLATALPAFAHNEFKSSDPQGGATLDTAPTSVVLTFSEELIDGQAKITVTGPDGANASTGTARLSGATATLPFKPTAAGAYTVAYKVVADDGDVTNSSFTFTLTAAAVPAPSTTSTTPTTATTPTTPATPAPATNTTSSGTPWWPWLVGGLVVIAVLVVVAVLVVRRRRSGTPR